MPEIDYIACTNANSQHEEGIVEAPKTLVDAFIGLLCHIR